MGDGFSFLSSSTFEIEKHQGVVATLQDGKNSRNVELILSVSIHCLLDRAKYISDNYDLFKHVEQAC